ncbi:hypothetical protein ACJ2CR_20615 [Myxococcus faecalis]|uniref:hypothetical protein n=1 Tax=Myxococcus faecalis TaxID=3115646 RepID=UPI0038D04F5F
MATLRVRETWKGSAPPDARIEVHFNRFACPATPDYEVGETVIALLEEEHGHWWTVALAFGVRRPANDSETEDYRRVVAAAREAQDRWIQARIVGKTPDYGAIHRDWQVLAAAHPVTRWDAMHGLAPSLHERDDADSPRVSAMRQLTWAQRDALAKSLVERPSLDDGFMRMLTLLRGYASADVDRVTANVIETLNQREWVSHAALEGLTLLRERLGEAPSPPRPAPDFNKSFDERVQEASRAFSLEWLAFKQRHGLKPRPLPLPVGSQPSIP